MYYQRKYHLKKELPDGNIWNGFINIEADNKEDLPETVQGSFWFERIEEGWRGYFTLEGDDTRYDRRAKPADFLKAWVITNAVYPPERSFRGGITSTAQAEAILRSIQPIEYAVLPKVEGRLEECMRYEHGRYVTETHCW